jgi:hypothetical protein
MPKMPAHRTRTSGCDAVAALDTHLRLVQASDRRFEERRWNPQPTVQRVPAEMLIPSDTIRYGKAVYVVDQVRLTPERAILRFIDIEGYPCIMLRGDLVELLTPLVA